MNIPAKTHLLELLRSEKRLLARLLATSLGRTALVAAPIFLIQEFLFGILGEGERSWFVQTVGRDFALWGVAFLLVLSYAGASLFQYDNQVVRQRMIKVIELGVMNRLIRHLLTLSVPFFDRQSHGDLIQAVRQDVQQLRMVILAYAGILMEAVVAMGLLASAVSISLELSFWALIVLPLASLPLLLIARRTRARSFAVRRTGYVLFDILLEILRGIRTIKTYQGEEAEAQNAIVKARRYFDEQIHIVKVHALSGVVLESLSGLSIAVVVIAGGIQVMHESLLWPQLVAFLMAVRTLQGPLDHLNENYMQIQRFAAASQRIEALLEERPDVRDAVDAAPLPASLSSISAEGLEFDYGDRRTLSGISFEAAAGETIGIVGPSGAGKTSLLALIARFYDPTRGAVCIDGRDLREFRLRDVYAKLAIVTQEPFLFATTIHENIRCGRPEATDDEVEAAARAAEIHEEISALPQGYETVIGHGGRGVSGGQAQRINVARAILKNASILLLDEATSSLDSIAEAKVQRAIERLVEGRTTFVVAHRLSTLRHADRIIVLEHGECVGLGSHEDLLESCPLYHRMWETQRLASSSPETGPPPAVEPLEDEEVPLPDEFRL